MDILKYAIAESGQERHDELQTEKVIEIIAKHQAVVNNKVHCK